MNNLLTESATPTQVIDLMKKRIVAAITYNGDGYNNYTRYVEFYAYGTTLAGKPCVIGWQRNNYSASASGLLNGEKGKRKIRPKDKEIWWRIFLLSEITSIQPTKTNYDVRLSFIDDNRPNYNEAYKNLGTVYYKIVPDGEPLPPKPEEPTDKPNPVKPVEPKNNQNTPVNKPNASNTVNKPTTSNQPNVNNQNNNNTIKPVNNNVINKTTNNSTEPEK